jgi:hypothetical protein
VRAVLERVTDPPGAVAAFAAPVAPRTDAPEAPDAVALFYRVACAISGNPSCGANLWPPPDWSSVRAALPPP